MKFTINDVYNPDTRLKITDWCFMSDLRQYFPGLDNNDIEKLLVERRIVNTIRDTVDCESACTYVYFQTKGAATAFLKRLNAMPEIRDYVEPTPKEFIVISIQDWNTVKDFLKVTLTKDQHQALEDLDINIAKWIE